MSFYDYSNLSSDEVEVHLNTTSHTERDQQLGRLVLHVGHYAWVRVLPQYLALWERGG